MFGVPRLFISDEGTHFCNAELSKVLEHYDVQHKMASPYHQQTNGQVEISNSEIKRILEKIVATSRKDQVTKLNDCLWVYRTAFKTPIGLSPFQIVYKKARHLPVELEKKAQWAMKFLNFDSTTFGEKRKVQLQELEEMRLNTYESSRFYKERTNRYHD